MFFFFFFSSRRRHTRWPRDWSSDVCSSDLGELVERIGREIIRRWLQTVPPELWHHQGREHFRREVTRFAKYEPGGPAGIHDTRAFHSGRWVPKTTEDDPE